jgi:hypothetical protein
MSIQIIYRKLYSLISALSNNKKIMKALDLDLEVVNALSLLDSYNSYNNPSYIIVSTDSRIILVPNIEKYASTISESESLTEVEISNWIRKNLLLVITYTEILRARKEGDTNMLQDWLTNVQPIYRKLNENR